MIWQLININNYIKYFWPNIFILGFVNEVTIIKTIINSKEVQ